MSDIMLYDSQTAFQGGMQSGVDPALVADHQYFRGINVSCREGTLDVRPSFDKKILDTSELASSSEDYDAAEADYDNAVSEYEAQAIITEAAEQDYTDAVNAIDGYIAQARSSSIINGIESVYGITLSVETIYDFLTLVGSYNSNGTGVMNYAVSIQRKVGPPLRDVAVFLANEDCPYSDDELWTNYQYYIERKRYSPTVYTNEEVWTLWLETLLNNVSMVTDSETNQADMEESLAMMELLKLIFGSEIDIAYDAWQAEYAILETKWDQVEYYKNILDSTVDFEEIFKSGKFQGAEIYNTGNWDYIVEVINGHIFMVNLNTGKVTGVTTVATMLDPLVDRCFFVQAERFMIIQDGKSQPRILEGASLRLSDPSVPEIPPGTNMAYGHGRIAIQVSSRHFLMSDLYYAYDPENVLKMEESSFLNEGGGFTVSGRLGNIVSLQLAKVADTSTGDGPLLVICENGFTTYAINNQRIQWNNIGIAKIQLFGTGIVGNNAFCHITEDILYRSHEGIRSYLVGQREAASGYKYTELSKEVEPYMQNDMQFNGKFISMASFDKRMLSLTAPQGMKARTSGYQEIEADYEEAKTAALVADPAATDLNVYSKYSDLLSQILSNTTAWTPKTKVGGGSFTYWLEMDAANKGYIQFMPDDTVIPQSFTVHIDFYYTGLEPGQASAIAAHCGTYQNAGWNIGIGESLAYADKVYLTINGVEGSGYAHAIDTQFALTKDDRHRITLTYDHTTFTAKMLIDGETVFSSTGSQIMGTTYSGTVKARIMRGVQGGWTNHLYGRPHQFVYLNRAVGDDELAAIHDKYTSYPTEGVISKINFRGPKTNGLADDTGSYPVSVIMIAGDETYAEALDEIWYREIIGSAKANPAPADKTERIQKILNAATSDQTDDVADAALLKAYYDAYKAKMVTYVDDTYFKGIIAFDFSLAGYTKSTNDSSSSRMTSGSYDGIWTGIRPTQLLTTVVNGRKRCFATTKDANNHNSIYEITRRQDGYDNMRGKVIECILDTRAMPFMAEQTYIAAPFVYKKLEEMVLWVSRVKNDVNIKAYVATDVINSFTQIGELNLKALTQTALDPRSIGGPQSRTMIKLWDMNDYSDPTTKHLIRLGNEFQFRLVWTGHVRFRRLFTAARKIEKERQNNNEITALAYPIDTFNQYRYSAE